MKRLMAFLVVAVLAVSMAGLSVFAADAPAMTAKAGAATIDGKISSGEYGDAVVLDGSNTISWKEGTLDFAVNFYFAWSESAFDIAISAPAEKIKTGDQFQMNFNPGGLIIDADSGLFLTIILGEDSVTIKQHNWSTALVGTADAAGVDITDKIKSKVGNDGSNTVVELSLPVDFFKIIKSANNTKADGSAFKLEAGELIGNPFVVIGEQGYTTKNCTGVTSGDWTIKGLNLGTIKLEAGNGNASAPSPTEKAPSNNSSSNNNNKTENATTFDLGIVSLAAVALSSAVAVKKRKS